MEQPLIYKYKPNSIDDFNFDIDFKNVIRRLLNCNLLNILIVGDSGSCKTSLLNIICKEYYGESYDKNNILVINSLKEQGISYYRTEVKTFCQTICTVPNKKKIILIDDLDLINENSQQVFRNCLDKYSKNVNFIASCTNLQKVIETYQSRVNIFKIKSISNEFMYEKINNIIKNENIIIDKDAISLLVNISNHSMRIMINYLEKFKLINKPINCDLILNTCTNISLKFFNEFTNICKDEKNIFKAIKMMLKLIDEGYSVIDILDNYFIYIKVTNNLNEKIKYKIIILICKYITNFYNLHEDEIELVFFTNNLIKLFD